MITDTTTRSASSDSVLVHPLIVRATHWINALVILIMILSGWRIYNASPIFDFKFPNGITLGGWLGGALQWHFAAMWLLVLNGFVYLCYGVVSGRFKSRFFPIAPRALFNDILDALHGKLAHHDLTVYNTAQRGAYVAVIFCAIVLVLSGLAIWKPVQMQELTALCGGFMGARIVHFIAMALLALIVVAHITMVILVPRTFPIMITGRTRRSS